jgi:hypothetical protein
VLSVRVWARERNGRVMRGGGAGCTPNHAGGGLCRGGDTQEEAATYSVQVVPGWLCNVTGIVREPGACRRDGQPWAGCQSAGGVPGNIWAAVRTC